MQRLFHTVSAMLLAVAAGSALAQDQKAPGASGANPEIRKLLTGMEDCFNRGDAKGLAACWTPQGDFVGPSGDASRDATPSKRRSRSSLPPAETPRCKCT